VHDGRGVLDTSTVILLSQIADPAVLPAEPTITAVTLAELSVGPLVADSEQERAPRQAHVQQAEADFDPLPFDAAAARAFGGVAASLRRAGPKAQARTYDAMIAATAIANGLPVYTCNPADFAGIDGLVVIPVPTPRGLRALTVRAEPDDIEFADATHTAGVDDGQERNRDHGDDQHV
jgi:predicted nucleic acid-binding protein